MLADDADIASAPHTHTHVHAFQSNSAHTFQVLADTHVGLGILLAMTTPVGIELYHPHPLFHLTHAPCDAYTPSQRLCVSTRHVPPSGHKQANNVRGGQRVERGRGGGGGRRKGERSILALCCDHCRRAELPRTGLHQRTNARANIHQCTKTSVGACYRARMNTAVLQPRASVWRISTRAAFTGSFVIRLSTFLAVKYSTDA